MKIPVARSLRLVSPFRLSLSAFCVVSSLTHAEVGDLSTPSSFAESEGIELGNFGITTEVEAGVGFTNNAWQDSSHEEGALRILSVSSAASSANESRVIAVSFDYFGQNYVEEEFSALDIASFSGNLFGRFQLTETSAWRVLLKREETILGLSQEAQLNGIQAGTEVSHQFETAFEWDNDSVFWSVMARSIDSVTDSFDATEDGYEEESLDRKEHDFIGYAGRTFDWGRAFVYAGVQRLDYTEKVLANFSFSRDSDETRYGLGFELDSGKISGDGSLHIFNQDFDSRIIKDIENELVGKVSLNYQINDTAAGTVEISRSFFETNIPGSAGLLTNRVFAGASFAPWSKSYIKVGPTITQTTIVGSALEIDRSSFDLEAAWEFTPELKVFLRSSVAVTDTNKAAIRFLDAQAATTYLSIAYAL